MQFRYLFAPLKVGPVTVRNRLVSTAHYEGLSDGVASQALAEYHAEKAKGGIGLTIMGMALACPEAGSRGLAEHMVMACDPRAVPGWRRVAEMVHQHGGKVFVQLGAHGALGGEVSACAIPDSGTPRRTTRSLLYEEIRDIVECYGRSARHAREAGIDGIEIHGHGDLTSQFLSPFWNKRSDRYGGSLENRLRFLEEILDATRQHAGPALAIGFRLSADELLPGGLTLEDNQEIARRLVDGGRVDFLDVDIGVEPHRLDVILAPMYVQPGYQVYAAAAIREAVGSRVPVFTVGRITDPLLAEKILADGQADMVGMTRAHICDPEIANKAREGRLDDIRPCLGDNENCIGRIFDTTIRCTYNPGAGREREWGIGTLHPAATRKRVLVAGGGPGGMEAARVAALRGHDVVLHERNLELGGQINLAALLPGREEMLAAVRWYEIQLRKAGVKVVLGTEVTKDLLGQVKPHAVVVATGASFVRDGFNAATYQPIPGGDLPHVLSLEDALLGRAEIGSRVVIYDDFGFIEAPGLAERLADRGKQVQILTKYPSVGRELVNLMHLPFIYKRILRKGVQLVPLTVIASIEGDAVNAYNVYTRETTSIPADNVVLITAKRQNDALFHDLKGQIEELYRVGDCSVPFHIYRAVSDGHRVGRLL